MMYSLHGSNSFIKMNKFCENTEGGDIDSDAEDPEQLLNEWLGELDTLTGGLDPTGSTTHLKPLNSEIAAPRIDSYRFSMANLEDSQDVDLDAILGELCALETVCEREIGQAREKRQSEIQSEPHYKNRPDGRPTSEVPRMKLDPDDSLNIKNDSGRTESPDNDSAFSDTVSMLSSESSASSGGSGAKPQTLRLQSIQQDDASRVKAEKIKMAMEKIKEANIQKLFLKVFTTDGSAKSLLVDEKMICSYVTRLLADKNHVPMEPKWAIVEHLPDLYMERFYEDHELLVDNLLLWTRDSKNKIYFVERPDKIKLFLQPEKFLLSPSDKKENQDFDEHSRNMLLEEYFSTTNSPEVEGPLYLKADSKKGWKRHHFVLRASGLYYFPKDKVKSAKDLVCLATFDNNQIYYGLGWKKKYKAPTDYCFAIKHPRLQEPKSTKYIKYLCAEDQASLERWMVGMRIAKFGKRLMDNYRSLIDELAQEDLDILAHARSCSVSSIAVHSFPSNVTTPTQGYQSSEAGYGTQSETYSTSTDMSTGRHSRASSSSSSGCMSDGAPSSCENAFDSEFPMGTIKRKPSMKPSLPLTNITRQLKEVGENRDETDGTALPSSPINYTSSGTLTRSHNRRKSNQSDDSSNTGTLKRQHSYKSRGSIESMGSRSGGSTPLCGTPVRERSSPFSDRNGSIVEYPSSNGYLRGSVSPTGNLPSCMTDSITSLPPPPETNGDVILNNSPNYSLPPPPPEVYNSNLSLDSLPPPPNPGDLPPMTGGDLTGSQLSLMSLPPPPSEAGTLRKRSGASTPVNVLSPERTPTQGMSPDLTPTHSRLNTPVCSPPPSNAGSGCSTPVQGAAPPSFARFSPLEQPGYASPQYRQSGTLPGGRSPFNNAAGLRSSLRQTSLPRQTSCNSIASTNSSSSSGQSVQHKVSFQEPISPKKTGKKISFNLTPQEVPPLPKKPPPPKRAETTKLTSPKKLAEPPVEFLKDLQRVMRKKWQVAQKCKLEPETTPHEVLGFRDPPVPLPDYKEHNVSNWVQEHYGPNNLYENIYRDNQEAVVDYATSPVHNRSSAEFRSKRPPPPPPPKRSETTHLSTPKTY
ncbi:unnamed protein product [Phyllotreta striolata]|uniref:Uncharacterized protein n=1 Tax=Phyllotreta striolata TaxID=444603 RepID=A0A9N9TRZ1_PHYSR|nr:unnamed protein product [Phyllotreta striolata]